jgi:hypothetical protein
MVATLAPSARVSSGATNHEDVTHYRVDGTKLAEARLVLKTYEPVVHFHPSCDVPAIRLADFSGPK